MNPPQNYPPPGYPSANQFPPPNIPYGQYPYMTEDPEQIRARWQLPRRTHPLSPLIKLAPLLIAIVLLLVPNINASNSTTSASPGLTFLSLLSFFIAPLVIALGGFITWRFRKFWIENGELKISTIFISKDTKHVKLSRIQAVDITEPLTARLFSLAAVRITVAGSSRSKIVLAYLRNDEAHDLRTALLLPSPGSDPMASIIAQMPEVPLIAIKGGELVGSTLSRIAPYFALLTLIVIVVIASTGVIEVFAFLPFSLFYVAVLASKQYTTWSNFKLGTVPGAFRLAHGLLTLNHETIMFNRIQAIRVEQPLVWRPFGWYRVKVNVAGLGDLKSQNMMQTVLFPVGSLSQAFAAIHAFLPELDLENVDMIYPPSRAAWRAPWWSSATSVGSSPEAVVVRRGRIKRQIDIMRMEKVQSVRITCGPWERLLGIGSLALDSTPGPVKCIARWRDLSEARLLTEHVAIMARQARMQKNAQ
ncbi:MAG: PH domain-containing protein [Acidimicrobiales bacterium]|nr:PH domain-containing protein [Acidimicrobiales bacterium]